ncbi:MAG TPA: hemerythrin domain-containing protein [Actinomycetota bacterium]|nr:hemerythrin domain-containing protein [Actinomycetota bacterium]
MDPVFGSASELATFGAESFTPTVLFESERMKVVLAGLEADQRIELHAPQVDLAVAVLEGLGDLWVDDRPRPVRPGDVAVIPAGSTRGVRARGGRLVLLHVVSPPPSAADHQVEHRAWPSEEAGPEVRAVLHQEHQELLPHLGHLGALAEQAPDLDEATLRERLHGVVDFLTHSLLPHAGVEEQTLYPAVDGLLRATGGGTGTMSIDHAEIGERIQALAAMVEEPLNPSARTAIVRALEQLEAIVRLHFRKEEEAYLPLLSRLSAAEASELSDALSALGAEHHHEG